MADTSRIASRVLVGHRAQAGRCVGTIPPAPEVQEGVVMIMIQPDGKDRKILSAKFYTYSTSIVFVYGIYSQPVDFVVRPVGIEPTTLSLEG